MAELYLDLVTRTLPGRIEGLYLVGSVALSDYQAGHTDIDFVAVTSSTLAPAELDRLEEIHKTLLIDMRRPWFDGIYVTWADLERNPAHATVVACTHEGRFTRSAGFEANPSTWLTLRNHPLAVCGPTAPRLWYDLPTIQEWNIGNLNAYWRGVLHRGRGMVNGAAVLGSDRLMSQWLVWCVPGVARLHYTITHGDTISKSGACHYASTRFPARWNTVIQEALAVRNASRPPRRGRLARRRDVLDFMEFVIGDANTLFDRTS